MTRGAERLQVAQVEGCAAVAQGRDVIHLDPAPRAALDALPAIAPPRSLPHRFPAGGFVKAGVGALESQTHATRPPLALGAPIIRAP
ncbi:MAG: hypothetical protein ACOCYW_07515, partial [Roseicyclus sp.]